MITLYPHQEESLKMTKDQNRVAYYLDMGLGKTFVGSEKMMQLDARVNLVICQKSKVEDWLNHFKEYYGDDMDVWDLTKPKEFITFIKSRTYAYDILCVAVINYDLIFRRPELAKLKDFTLMLDESSLIQNETSKRSKFILNKLKPKNVILLSGTPTAGKYEKLWSQCRLLGWSISKELYWNHYVITEIIDNDGFPIKVVRGYKNTDRLKEKLREHGAVFMKSEEVFDLPEQTFISKSVPTNKNYRKFKKDCLVVIDGKELVGDTTLTKMLYERQLCGLYSKEKLQAFTEIVESTEDRLIVFYNFTEELNRMLEVLPKSTPISIVNGQTRDLTAYENNDNAITFIQYQAGSMGLNLQKANKIVYFTPPLSSEFYEQSKKRTHRIGQTNNCFYYNLVCKNSIEEKIYKTLKMRKNYTEALFESE